MHQYVVLKTVMPKLQPQVNLITDNLALAEHVFLKVCKSEAKKYSLKQIKTDQSNLIKSYAAFANQDLTKPEATICLVKY